MTEASGASTTTGTELSVRTESVQRLYLLYGADRFRVNRRYQRKLVWSVEEKQKLIDSVLLPGGNGGRARRNRDIIEQLRCSERYNVFKRAGRGAKLIRTH